MFSKSTNLLTPILKGIPIAQSAGGNFIRNFTYMNVVGIRKVILYVVVCISASNTLAATKAKNPMASRGPINAFCHNTFSYIYYGYIHHRTPPVDTIPNFFDDDAFLTAQKSASALGKVNSIYDPKFDTRVYYTATARPKPDGSIPAVDPEAKALFIYLHGSGTQKGSGRSFSYKATALANMGYAVISPDHPFHKDGPLNPKLAITSNYMEYLNDFIQSYRVEGQKVYLIGHSFGPDLIAEYLRRYPFGVDGGVLISPASYNPKLQKYFEDVTSAASLFWGDTKPNHTGAHWGGVVMTGKTWTDPVSEKSPDPTVANPNLRVRILSGANDEYFPGKLDESGEPTKEPRDYDIRPDFEKVMKNAVVTIEPGVGHYIFDHTDANGHDVVLREILAIAGQSLENEKQLKKEAKERKYSNTEQLLMRYQKEPFFQKWMDEHRGGKERLLKAFNKKNEQEAIELGKEFQQVMDQRMTAIYNNIRETKNWAPDFFEANKEAIEKLGTKGTDSAPLVKTYAEYLKNVPQQKLKKYAFANQDTLYVTPTTIKNIGKSSETEKRTVTISPEQQEAQRIAKLEKQKKKEAKQNNAN